MNNGDRLTHFYQLYENPEYEECLRFAMGFEGYMDNIGGVHKNIKSGVVHFANFNKESECKINKQYYPPLMNEDNVKNDCSLKENIIISAPNKAGKTTILKTTTINIIFSQQVGCGFYTSATINPYTHIHSYLNIPDTSERDSLFQAESRRCKEIIDIINENPDTTKCRHFCIFDELYSGTNPDEATSAGKAFLSYLSKYPNVRFMLTTHYVKICKHFKKSNVACNYKMVVDVLPDGNFDYKYKMKKGISQLKGGIRVLKDMNYPEEILADLA
jgi:DNA mismatch repair ATPase MutS